MKNKNKIIDWDKVAKEEKTFLELAKELKVNEKTIRRNLKKRGLAKERTYSKGPKHYMWKIENVGYIPLHQWVRRNKSKPQFCEECGHNPPMDVANISGEYKRDIKDFRWLCRRCHMKGDG